jgi:release factor glutamine methyltransferase
LSRVTVLESIQKSAEFLAKKEVDSPRLQAELLLAHVLGLPRMQLYLSFERTLTEAEVEGLREQVRRRGRREPLQHILGSTSFCGLEIAVNRHTLIPRPETELLAEAGWTFLATLNPGTANGVSAVSVSPTPAALDLGTGSGCIAIALAVKRPGLHLQATDISNEALAVARQNAARHELLDRIRFSNGDGFAAVPAGARFDLVISNPPYIPSAELESLQPEVRDHDPRTALDGGPDGLEFYRRFAAGARPYLNPQGRLMVELGDGQADAVRGIFQSQKWVVESVKTDYSRRPRVFIAKPDPTAANGVPRVAGGFAQKSAPGTD